MGYEKYKKVFGIFSAVILTLGILVGTYTAGYIVGKEKGYDQRRHVEVEIGQILQNRGKVFQKRY